MTLTVGVDVGGTKVAAGVVDETGRILARTRRPSPARSAEALRATIVESVEELRQSHDVAGVGISAAGFVATDRRQVIFAPNLDWGTGPVADVLAEEIGVPCVLENDANAAAWAEYVFGAGVRVPDQLMVAIGTGVGGGLILGGRIYRGGHGVSAEIGHMGYMPGGRPCPCGRRGCLEQYASGSALVRTARAAAEAGKAPHLLEAAGGDAEKVTGQLVNELALAGREDAVAVYQEVAGVLGTAVASLVAILDPSLVVLGGGVSTAGELLRAPVEAAMLADLTAAGRRPAPRVVLAALGNEAAIIGASDLVRQLLD